MLFPVELIILLAGAAGFGFVAGMFWTQRREERDNLRHKYRRDGGKSERLRT